MSGLHDLILFRTGHGYVPPVRPAHMKPTIRRNAKPGDIILGSGSGRAGLAGRLIYAMRVDAVLPYEVYWVRYRSKRPSSRSMISRRGDNIWHRQHGEWHGVSRGPAQQPPSRARLEGRQRTGRQGVLLLWARRGAGHCIDPADARHDAGAQEHVRSRVYRPILELVVTRCAPSRPYRTAD